MRSPRSGRMALALSLVASMAGCLGLEPPPPTSAPPGTSQPVQPSVRAPDELVVAIPSDPAAFIPGGADAATSLVGDLLYDPLYRLDTSFLPHPALAAELPEVSEDGLTWTVPLRSGARSHAGQPMTAADAVFSLRVAASAACPFDRELCAAVAANLGDVAAPEPERLVVTLRSPWAPFLNRVLGALPILSEAAVQRAVDGLRASASGSDVDTLRDRIDHITAETNADRCLVAAPPSGCRLADHVPDLESLLTSAGVVPPPAERSAGPDGAIDEEAHGAALLDAVAHLAGLLGSEGVDAVASAIPLVDVSRSPLGGGPFRLEGYQAGRSVSLLRHEAHLPEPAGSGRIRMLVVRDAAVAATALRAGDVDWVVELTPEEAGGLTGQAGIIAAAHPQSMLRSIAFNVRPGRTYADPVARRAFALCLDRDAAARDAPGASQIGAIDEVMAGSWVLSEVPPAEGPDPAEAIRTLAEAGWERGSDGVFTRGSVRLSSTVHVRTGRADLFGFAQTAAQQLAACGIELLVDGQSLSTDELLEQLRWPNDFETLLTARTLSTDPGLDLGIFTSDRATTEENPTDANPGGYTSPTFDALLTATANEADPQLRAELLAEALAHLRLDPPTVPIWYDAGHAAVSARVRAADGQPIDPGAQRYAWDLWTWHDAGG